MHFSKILAVVALAASVTAAPADIEARTDGGKTVGEASNECGNNQQLYCCNSGFTLLGLLTGNCNTINVVAVANQLLSDVCQGQVNCCSASNTGALINIQCLQIQIWI